MKNLFVILVLIFPIMIGAACDSASPIIPNNVEENETNVPMKTMIIVKVGDKTFIASLLDNASANAFKAKLPLKMNMTELNGNEKYYRFPNDLPTDASNPGTINAGDLMLWGSNTLVIFYETFSTSYSYTKLGKIEDPTGLASALGSGNVSVTFELQ